MNKIIGGILMMVMTGFISAAMAAAPAPRPIPTTIKPHGDAHKVIVTPSLTPQAPAPASSNPK